MRLLVPSGAMRNDAPEAAIRAALRALSIAALAVGAVDGDEAPHLHRRRQHREAEELLLPEHSNRTGNLHEDRGRIQVRVVVHHVDEVRVGGNLLEAVGDDLDPGEREPDAHPEAAEPEKNAGVLGDERVGDADETRGEGIEGQDQGQNQARDHGDATGGQRTDEKALPAAAGRARIENEANSSSD